MPTSPATSPIPPPVFMPQISIASAAPTSTPMPPPAERTPVSKPTKGEESIETAQFPLPKLRLEIRDLNHASSQTFLTAVVATDALQTAVQSVLALLYESPHCPTTTIPTTRSVTLILRSMEGVAYTTGSELDNDHKEIHFSLDYIQNAIGSGRKKNEIMGVLTHEMVHCYQYDAFSTCPGGLIEGIADWVRLNADLSPPHWKKEAGGKWDAGYQHTGYFLEYLERRFGKGTVRRLNEKLRIERYEEKRFWTELCGRPVKQLWKDYSDYLEAEKRKCEEEECVIVEKEDAAIPRKFESGGDDTTTLVTKTKDTSQNA
ncbi:hypothetical protein EYC84_005463 [Monilinia fructicola]|uniref:Uncharacterized protein n=1 Tax=Monilinia fructicola TaxID=38448 RepID=A0A5M9JWL2_MONFR|nr:hypothetical protein EYC84_005463 [Monilinia fructicola]